MGKSFGMTSGKTQTENTSAAANMRNVSRKLMQRDTGGDNRYATRVKPALKPHDKPKYQPWKKGDYDTDY